MIKERIFTRNFWFAFVASFSLAMQMYCLSTTITEYAQTFGATELIAGTITGIYYIAGISLRLWSGYGMNRYGWKRVAVIGIIFHALTCFGYFLVNSTWALLIVRFLHGIGFGLSASATAAIGMAILPKSRHGEASGYMMVSMTLAVALGPYVGGILYDAFGAVGCFVFAQILCVLTLICTLCVNLDSIVPKNGFPMEAHRKERGLRRFLEPAAIPVGVCAMLIVIGYTSLLSFYRIYAAKIGLEQEFRNFFLIYAGVLLFSRPIAGKVQDHYGPSIICYVGIVAQTVGLFLIALYPCMWTIIICAVFTALGNGSVTSVLASVSCRDVTIERHTYGIGTYWAVTDVGTGFGPLILGAVVTASGSYPIMYLTAAVITFAALFVYLGATRRKKKA